MDAGALAAAIVGMTTAQTQQAVAAKMMKMNADAGGAIADLLQAAQDNLTEMVKAINPPGVGGQIDVSA